MSDYVVEGSKIYRKQEVPSASVDTLIDRAVSRCARIDAEIAKLQAEKAECEADHTDLVAKKAEANAK